MKKKNVVKCLVKEIYNDRLIIMFADKLFECSRRNITDYDTPLDKMFAINKAYKFSFWKDENGNEQFSYKLFRPKLNKNRNKPIPTISGFKNVNSYMHEKLKTYTFKNEKEKK